MMLGCFQRFGTVGLDFGKIALELLNRALVSSVCRRIRRRKTPGSASGTGWASVIACRMGIRFRDQGKAGNRLFPNTSFARAAISPRTSHRPADRVIGMQRDVGDVRAQIAVWRIWFGGIGAGDGFLGVGPAVLVGIGLEIVGGGEELVVVILLFPEVAQAVGVGIDDGVGGGGGEQEDEEGTGCSPDGLEQDAPATF